MTAHRPGITGATALVTGASRGIGAGIATALAAAGALVVLTGRDADALEEVRARAGASHALTADLTDSAQVADLHRRTRELAGPVDLVVACAGGLGEPVALVDTTDEQWHATVDANLTATFHTLRAFLPDMIERRRGAVVTIASTAARRPSPSSPAYGAANAGLLMLTQQTALQVAEHGVRVNAIAPGTIHTERFDRLVTEEARARVVAMHPLARLGTPDDVAQAALYLLGDDASWVTGVTLDVNGGRVMV
jgi:3-oxoacyl-[acyl-carrier protein] reductase